MIKKALLVAAKGNHALALREDDTIWGWGDNFYGQVGDGTGTMRLTPVQVCPDSDLTDDCNAFRGAAQDSGIQQIAAGYVHSMALTGDGRVWAWGNNSDGQMGDGMVDDRPRPHEVCPVSDVSDECVAFRAAGSVQEISGRYDSNAALTEDGRLWTWGNNYAGTLGHGTSGPDSGARLPQPVIGYDAIGGRLDLELHRPTNQAPADGANAANPVVLDTAAYQHDAPSAPAHGGTQWQVSKSSGFSTLVLDTTFVSAAQMFSPAALNGQSLGELAVGETYWWRARHRTENGDWSYWSTPTSFTVLESSGANLSDTSLDFGSVAVGANSATQSVTLTNDGGSALNLTGVNVYGDYAIVSNACAPFPRVLNASQQCAIELRFSPTATGVREGLLSITSDHAASPHAVNLTGTGTAAAPTPAPALSLSPTDHDFGSVAVGATSDAQAIALTNIGTATLSGITLQLLGDYQQVSSTCGATLAASGSCTVDVRFAPTGTGARPGGRVVSSDAEESPHVAYFQGTGTAAGSVPAPAVSLTPSTLTFVAQTVGTVSAAQTVTLRNDGDAPLTNIDVEVYGTFSVESNCTAPLAVSGECSLQVRAAPQYAGSFTGLIAVTTDAAGSPHLVGLSGSGTAAAGAPAPVLTFSPTSLSFGSVNLGSESAVATLTLGNGGNAVLSSLVLEVLGDYVIASNNCGSSLAAGAGCSVGIRFRPQAAGTRVGGLVIRSNAAGSPQVVGLSGTGVQATQTPDGGSNDDAGGDSGGGSGGGDDATSGGGLSVSGGCTLAGSEAATDPTLPLLVLAGLVAAWRGRRGVGQSAIR